jgi:hypothetical protein
MGLYMGCLIPSLRVLLVRHKLLDGPFLNQLSPIGLNPFLVCSVYLQNCWSPESLVKLSWKGSCVAAGAVNMRDLKGQLFWVLVICLATSVIPAELVYQRKVKEG